MNPSIMYVIIAIAAAVHLECVVAQDTKLATNDAKAAAVKIVFRNTTTEPVDIYFVKIDEQESEQEILYFQNLAQDFEQEQESIEGQIWRVKQNGKIIAEYEAVNLPVQPVDIHFLAVWQAPVQLVIQNTTEQPLDVFWVDRDGAEIMYADDVPAGKQITQPANAGQVWRIRNGDKVVAEYIPDISPQQILEIDYLISIYTPAVNLTFVNNTGAMLDVAWVNLDGDEIIYGDDVPSGNSLLQQAYPYQLWRILRDEVSVAEYTVTEDAVQTIDLKQLITDVQPANDADVRKPPKPPKPGDNGQ